MTTNSIELNVDKELYIGTDDVVTISLKQSTADLNKNSIDSVDVTVTASYFTTDFETITLYETSENSGLFTGELYFERFYNNYGETSPMLVNGKICIYADGSIDSKDTITVFYEDGNTSISFYYEEPESTISGYITDDENNIITGAQVHLFNSDRSIDFTIHSRADGIYAFYDIPNGFYSLEAFRDGYTYFNNIIYVE